MSEHLSALVLDELAAGLGVPPGAAEHVRGCEACAGKLEGLKAQHAKVLAHPEAGRRLDALLEARARAEPAPVVSLAARRLRAIASAALPLAAGLVLIVAVTLVQPRGGDRLKGASTVELLDRSGAVVTRAAPGDVLTLAIGGAGLPYGAVFTVDASGAVAPLWPMGSVTMGPVDPGARVRLAELETTPGDVRVVGFFGRTRRPMAELRQALEAEISRAKAQGRSPLEVKVPAGVADATAEVRLDVR